MSAALAKACVPQSHQWYRMLIRHNIHVFSNFSSMIGYNLESYVLMQVWMLEKKARLIVASLRPLWLIYGLIFFLISVNNEFNLQKAFEWN